MSSTESLLAPATPPAFVTVVIGREVRRITFPTPQGTLEGYQLRLQLSTPMPDGQHDETWSEWFHLPNPLMEYLAKSLAEFMHSEGHLALAA